MPIIRIRDNEIIDETETQTKKQNKEKKNKQTRKQAKTEKNKGGQKL